MGIKSYKKEITPGVYKTMYLVVAEAINKYTGKRIQKKRRGILSEPKAEKVHRELWAACRDERPDGINFTLWGQLLNHYLFYVEKAVRSESNPLGFSPHSIWAKQSRLKHTEKWSDTHLDLFTPQFVIQELDKMERDGISRSVTNHVLKEVKCVFNHGLMAGAIKTNPFIGLKLRKMPKKRKEALTHEEVNFLLAEAKSRNHPYYLIWLLTIALGLRRSELAGLKWFDINFDRGLINLQRQLIPKEGLVEFLKDREERVVAIPNYVVPILKEMKLKCSSEFVIENDCPRWKSGYQSEILRAFCREIGIKEVTHHQLRATHITLALIDGVPLGIVKENVGHSRLSTTDLYFRSAGINMMGQLDGLKISVPQNYGGIVLPLKREK